MNSISSPISCQSSAIFYDLSAKMKRGSGSRESVRMFRVFPRAMLGRPCVLFVSMRAGRFSTTLPRAICKTACYVHSVRGDAWNVLTAFSLSPQFVSAVYRARNAPWTRFIEGGGERETETCSRRKYGKRRKKWERVENGGCVATQDSVPLIGLADRSTRSLEDKDPEEVPCVPGPRIVQGGPFRMIYCAA